MSRTNVDNIKAIYQLATLTEQQDGITWYPKANQIAISLADRHEISEAQAIGVIAALSPRNRWERNVQDAEAIIAAYNAGGPEQAMLTKVCTFTSNKAKAIAILELSLSCTFAGVLAILSGPKLREFASCIAGQPDVCIDGHAFCIWAANRTGLKDVPAIGVKLRREIKADYITAADELGITPSACQAITWVTWRRLHGVTK
tara:strand:+ start:1896 stop:2501 length:606 start_codon:yes stop_codon:yes gene_type:complete